MKLILLNYILGFLVCWETVQAKSLRGRNLATDEDLEEEEECEKNGLVDDWDSYFDAAYPLYNAGNPDEGFGEYLKVGYAFVRHDCSRQVVCVFAKVFDYLAMEGSVENSWISDYALGGDNRYENIDFEGIQFVSEYGEVTGWEGCFSYPTAEVRHEIEIHANFGFSGSTPGNAASTGSQSENALIAIDLSCDTADASAQVDGDGHDDTGDDDDDDDDFSVNPGNANDDDDDTVDDDDDTNDNTTGDDDDDTTCTADELYPDWENSYATNYPMYNSGNPDTSFSGYEVAGYAFVRHECSDEQTLCVLAKVCDGFQVEDSTSNSWLKDYEQKGNGKYDEVDGVEFIEEDGVVVGWEGCFIFPDADVRDEIEIHANYGTSSTGNTASTGKKNNDALISLDLSCENAFTFDANSGNVNDDDDDDDTGDVDDDDGTGDNDDDTGDDDDDDTDDDVTRGTGGGFGDPHLKTWRGEIFDFHGECDIVLARSAKFSEGLGLEIDLRTTIRKDWSFISSVAVKIGTDILEVGKAGSFYFNGVFEDGLIANKDLGTIGGFPVKYFYYGTRRHKFHIDLMEKGTVEIKVYNEFLAVAVNHADHQDFADSVGMMGDFETGELRMRDGSVTTDTTEFGYDWQVQETSLFQKPGGPQYPEVCRMPTAKAIARRRLEESMVSA